MFQWWGLGFCWHYSIVLIRCMSYKIKSICCCLLKVFMLEQLLACKYVFLFSAFPRFIYLVLNILWVYDDRIFILGEPSFNFQNLKIWRDLLLKSELSPKFRRFKTFSAKLNSRLTERNQLSWHSENLFELMYVGGAFGGCLFIVLTKCWVNILHCLTPLHCAVWLTCSNLFTLDPLFALHASDATPCSDTRHTGNCAVCFGRLWWQQEGSCDIDRAQCPSAQERTER